MKFVLNKKGLADFARSKPVRDMIEAKTAEIADRAGEGFDRRVVVGNRARGYVRAKTIRARRRQARDHVLEKALGGASW